VDSTRFEQRMDNTEGDSVISFQVSVFRFQFFGFQSIRLTNRQLAD